jgi:rhamnose transport system permease protein
MPPELGRRERAVAAAYVVLLAVVSVAAEGFLSPGNLRDLAVAHAPTLVAAVGMTLVIVARQIDISIGSQLAVGGVLAGLLAKAGLPMPLVAAAVLLAGGLMGAANGALVTAFALPSIVVTLATMVSLREGLRWATQGADVLGLPDDFQWLGLGQAGGRALVVGVALATCAFFAWATRSLAGARAVYATGSDQEMARLLGVPTRRVTFGVFVLMGVLTAAAALLASIRFPQVQVGAGLGFELQVVAAVVVGGTAVSGGRGSIVGTLLGVMLLGTIGTALTFLHVSAHWEKAVQGAIILLAVAAEGVGLRRKAAHA